MIFLFGCFGSSVPNGVMPRDKMVNLLTQLHIVDGSMVSYSQTPDTLYKYGTAKYLHLFKSYGTDSTQFRRSFLYYASQTVVFNKMYDDVVKNLTAKTDSINKVRIAISKRDSAKNANRTKAIQDSIKRASARKPAISQKGGKN